MIITNVRLVDVARRRVQSDVDIHLDGDRIRDIVPTDHSSRAGLAVDADDVIDGTGLTALPGLINCHVHLAYSGESDPRSRGSFSPAEEAVRAAGNAVRTLVSGVTTVRDCGSRTGATVALAREVAAGGLPGPRIFTCGSAITITGGHGHWFAREADGESDVRRAVREQVKMGADWVKAIATGGVTSPGTDVGASAFSEGELRVLVEEAARRGRRVAAHAIGTDGIISALRAGAASIEHGSFLDDRAIELMLEVGASHVPTLSAYHRVVTVGKDRGVPKEAVAKAQFASDANLRSFVRSHAAGVNVAAGTDAGTPFNFHGGLGLEVSIMLDAGVDPIDALRICTLQAAKNLAIDDQVGSLEVGKQADLLLVAGDPLASPEHLDTPAVVIQGGQVVARDGKLSTNRDVVPHKGSLLVGEVAAR